MSRFTKVVAAFGAGSVLLLLVGQWAHAQTPAQMEYERQQREYRQQQEQQRQDQQRLQQLQNDNARRQQEESNRFMRQTGPNSSGSNYPSPSASPTSPASGGGRTAQDTGISERRYVLAGQGSFVIQVPGGWQDQMQQARDGAAATIVLSPSSGKRFEVLLTPTSSTAKDRAPESREDIRAAVQRGAQSAKAWAVEPELRLQEIQGRSGSGFYFSATERAPKAGAHKFVTTGILRVGDRLVPFTILTHEGQASIVGQALDLLKTAAIDSTGGTAAAPRTTTVAGTSAHLSPATTTIQLSRYYLCEGERVAVLRCGSDSDDAYCSVQYPDRKGAATKGMTPELAERRGDVVKKLRQCEAPKS